MKNERGLTLVELLAVLAILGIIITLLGTVLYQWNKSIRSKYDKSTTSTGSELYCGND